MIIPLKENLQGQQYTFSVNTLGRFSLENNEQLLFHSTGSKLDELLAYLLVNRSRPLPREVIVEALWPETKDQASLKKLKNLTQRLKKSMSDIFYIDEAAVITYRHGCYSWGSKLPCSLDCDTFEALVQEGRSKKSRDPAGAINCYNLALTHYRGDFLPEFAFREWTSFPRHYYRQLYLWALFELITYHNESGNYKEVTGICEKAFRINPMEEQLHLEYMKALLNLGQKNRARAHYHFLANYLKQNQGLQPPKALQEFYFSLVNRQNINNPGLPGIKQIIKNESKEDKPLILHSTP